MTRRLFLHVCCGPCAYGALTYWRKRANIGVMAGFYNPNIQPFLEYRRRLTGAREVSEHLGVPLVVDEAYDPEDWFTHVCTGERSRCTLCIGQRLRRSAEEGVRQRCDAFSTSLSISPWQDHGVIQEQGRMVAEEVGLEFLYEDLRPLYRESRSLARRQGIYRQKYCGCIVSEWERYRDRR